MKQQQKKVENKHVDLSKNKKNVAHTTSVSVQKHNYPIVSAQDLIGNHGVLHRCGSDIIQAKLKTNQPVGKYEQEASRMEDQVMRMSESEKEQDERKICIDKLGNCDFYKCLSDITPKDKEKGYYWNYGYKYCNRFSESSLMENPKAARWIDCVKVNLQKEIVNQCFQFGNDLNKTKKCAYATHAQVYTDCGICELDKTFIDQFRVALVPDVSDLWGKEGLKQIGETALRCFIRPFSFQSIIDRFIFYGNLNEDELGKYLTTLATIDPEANYKIILGIIELLSNTFDDDDVALGFMKFIDEDDLNNLSKTADGRRILFLMESALKSGITFKSEKLQIERIGDKSSRLRIQPKLKIGAVNDKFEQEADQISEHILNMPDPSLTGKRNRMQVSTLNRKSLTTQSPELDPDIETKIESMRGCGHPLSNSTLNFMKLRFHHDFSQVKIHKDAHSEKIAQDINAKAFTVGQDIFLGRGQYESGTDDSNKLLAHELSHALQQDDNSIVQCKSIGKKVKYLREIKIPRGGVLGIADGLIKETEEYKSYMNAQLVWQKSYQVSEKQAITACRLIIDDLSKGSKVNWQERAQDYIKQIQLATKPLTVKKQEEVSTLCHRDFQSDKVPGSVARHCFVWGHLKSVQASPNNIQQKDTLTYDADNSGTADPAPNKNTICTNTFDVDPKIVKQNYIKLCSPEYYNLTSFNCCTCSYLALEAAGAKLNISDFPPQNHGMALPDSLGAGYKKSILKKVWWNDIDEIEEMVSDMYSSKEIKKVPLSIKATWIKDMCRGIYTTKNEGGVVIKLFLGTSKNERKILYKLVEGHEWSGDWKEGPLTIDDDIVDGLYRSQLDELRDIINGLK